MSKTHRNIHSEAEYNHRLEIFSRNLNKIKEHNSNPKFGYQLAITSFADMDESELNKYKGY